MHTNEILLASQEYLFPAVFHYYREPLVIARAKNQFVYAEAAPIWISLVTRRYWPRRGCPAGDGAPRDGKVYKAAFGHRL
jgi:hypothetical protein